MEVAKTIQKQIGHKALYMLGAQHLCAGDDEYGFLSFRVRGSNSNHSNYIKITLTWQDTYRVEGKRIWGMKVKDMKTVDGVYVDMLHKTIRELTGLNTSL